MDTLTRR